MPAAEHPGIVGERRDDVLDDLVLAGGAAVFVGDIQLVTAGEPDAQHDACHVAAHTRVSGAQPNLDRLSGIVPPLCGGRASIAVSLQ